MDVADPETALREASRILQPGGFVQFSIVHPASSTPTRQWMHNDHGDRTALAIGDYFDEGPAHRTMDLVRGTSTRARTTRSVHHHLRSTTWIRAVLAAGLTIEAIDEPHADDDTVLNHPEVADTRIAPYFLILRARKPPDGTSAQ